MKSYTAWEFIRQPAIVYREADLRGAVKIIHDRYPDREFILTAKDCEPETKPPTYP